MTSKTRKIVENETQAQADEFSIMRSRYGKAGLCTRCAPQAAYGHQYGFSQVHPPCAGCAETVAAMPTAQPNGWRSQSRRHGRHEAFHAVTAKRPLADVPARI